MYAIIRTGGKQYTVKPGDVLQVAKLEQELGSELNIKEVLLVGGEKAIIGKPLVANASVTVVITKQARTRKLTVFKKKRRHSYRKMKTHRQDYTEIFVKEISAEGQTAKADTQPHVVDVTAVRAQKDAERVAQARARRENKEVATESTPQKAAAKKAAPKKKVAKKSAAKKKTAKKVAKKKSK